MFKILLILSCALGFLWADEKTINQQISQNKSALKEQENKAKQINKKLQDLGNTINKYTQDYKTLEKEIQQIQANIQKNQKEYQTKQNLIRTLSKNQENLYKRKKSIEDEIIKVLAQDISIVLLLNDYQPESIQDLITEEVFRVLDKETQTHLTRLSNEQSDVIANINELKIEIENIKNFIAQENQKQEQLKTLQNQQKVAIDKLQQEFKQYNAELEKIVKERDSIQKILVDLNILKSQEKEKQKKREELAKTKPTPPQDTPISQTAPKTATAPSDFDVRQVASSYHEISTTKYKGSKTISPLEKFEVQKKFGAYFDPIYKMKIFNESVTLVPKGDDKVRSVLDGKVVFAKDTPTLKKVIIIEHKDNMHTIYSQLDKIAPTIKPGSAVKKGYTIGRVENALKFEVTLKDKHIDPLELISSK